jgi:hypothetical protein
MAHANILERQDHVKRLLDAGESIMCRQRRLLADQYGCSHHAIYADILFLSRPKNLKTAFPNPRIKAMIHARDGKVCQYCGLEGDGNYIVEHVIPASVGGIADPHNLTIACVSCNMAKKNQVWTPLNLDEITIDHPEWRDEILRRSTGPSRIITFTLMPHHADKLRKICKARNITIDEWITAKVEGENDDVLAPAGEKLPTKKTDV